jgi:hypothetical protein
MEILKNLWTGESVFCGNCGHHINCHNIEDKSLNDDYISSICKYDNGHYVCPCEEFKAQKTTTLRATNQVDVNEFEKVETS